MEVGAVWDAQTSGHRILAFGCLQIGDGVIMDSRCYGENRKGSNSVLMQSGVKGSLELETYEGDEAL